MIFTRALFIFDANTTYFAFDCFNFEMSTFLIAKILRLLLTLFVKNNLSNVYWKKVKKNVENGT